MAVRHTFLDLSSKNRVFIVGDIHGEYQMLEEELTKKRFQKNRDALISVGDLCDRGPESERFIEYIHQPWFYRVLGNHDLMPRMLLTEQATSLQIEQWGGSWFLRYPSAKLDNIACLLQNAPLSLTVLTPNGRRVGVVHADCFSDWNSHCSRVNGKEQSDYVEDVCLWSRQTFNELMEAQQQKKPFNVEAAKVSGIDHVFHGHTPLAEIFTCANRSWIDTGACFGGKLTVVEIDQMIEAI